MSFTNDAGDLAALPWEFVHLAGENAFLAAETSLTLGRYLEGEGFHDADFQSPDNKLRVLFVVCLPNWPEYDDERAATRQLIIDLRQLGRGGGLITTPSRMQLDLYGVGTTTVSGPRSPHSGTERTADPSTLCT